VFGLYAFTAIGIAAIYSGLPRAVTGEAREAPAPLTKSRARVFTLAALFSVDAFGGGLIVQSLLALWLFQRHGLSAATAGTIFFWTGVLSAISYLIAVRIAKRVGLLNTMVFTHIPANVCLILVPLAGSLGGVM